MLEDDQKALRGDAAGGRDVPQAGAICYRRNTKGELRILLVGSRRNGRWGVPKGHIDPGETSRIAAVREAYEEAGVEGIVDERIFGSFSYRKDASLNHYHVDVHLLEVAAVAADFPEKTIRRKRWFSLKAAMQDVSQPGLRLLLRRLQQKQ